MSDVLDLRSALARLGGDEELYADMVQFLWEDSPSLLTQLEAAIASQDASTIQRAAHSLKGLIANCGGVRAAEAAQRLENAGAAGDVVDAAHLLEPLRQEMDQLKRALDAAPLRRAVSPTHAR